MSERRVVITGIGVVTPIGNDLQTFWQNLLAGKSGIGLVTRFDPSKFDCKIGGEVKDFKPEQFLRAQPDQPGEGHYCPHRSFRRFEQGSQFVGRVKLDLGIVRVLGAHVIGFAQAVSHGEVVFADGPLQELRMAAR